MGTGTEAALVGETVGELLDGQAIIHWPPLVVVVVGERFRGLIVVHADAVRCPGGEEK